MNINKQLFDAITDNLNTVLDTIPTHPNSIIPEYEYYAMTFCTKALMSFYNCPEQSQKIPEKLLSAVFDCGIIVRNLFDTEKDFEKRQSLVLNFLESYDLWVGGWLDRLLPDEESRKDIEISRELTIEETTYLTYHRFGVEIADNGRLRDTLTVLVAVFLFASRMKLDVLQAAER